ncbi:hypothetical protein P43SY_009779 [Pythium insidiosum]|uniref:HD/PDEase domain-containing protein n=1 Tax=Pythium insidiosum TaxID=114742 RepID=A0AAD5LQ83_PYTIN|nr:hypothetical protein P43SY_009779 [Pythium insidiosum]
MDMAPMDTSGMKRRQTQTTIPASFSRREKPHGLKRVKASAQDAAPWRDALPDDDEDVNAGSVTDVDLCSSQEDAAAVVHTPQSSGRRGNAHSISSIDSQFQRLRHLHQLGAARNVYIGATHSRFEHCLGVAFLAEQMVQSIMSHQPYLPITRKDVLCIKIAGLCHDLGHGPFSHVFDGIFFKQLQQRGLVDPTFHWTHEKGSLDMFDHLLRDNEIQVEEYGLDERDLMFIKELIYGGSLPGTKERVGRPLPEQRFLYDFVNNAGSGLDVDKLDYFLRDAQQTGVKASCDVELLIQNAQFKQATNQSYMNLDVFSRR